MYDRMCTSISGITPFVGLEAAASSKQCRCFTIGVNTKIYTYSEARQKLAFLLDVACKEEEVRIRRGMVKSLF